MRFFRKSKIAGWGKKSKGWKMSQKVLNYVLQWHPTGGQQNFGIHFWKLAVIAQLKEQNEKNKTI